MIQSHDREYAGLLATILVVGRIFREGWDNAVTLDNIAVAAGAAAQMVIAVDRHLPPQRRKRK